MGTTKPRERLSRIPGLRVPLLLACAVAILAPGSAPALASEDRLPGWELMAKTKPTYLTPGGRAGIIIRVMNVGAADSDGTVTVTDVLPPGVTATNAGGDIQIQTVGNNEAEPEIAHGYWDCSGNEGGPVAGATVVTCVNDPEKQAHFAGGKGTPNGPGDDQESINEDEEIAIGIRAPQVEGTIAEPNRVSIAGGGALGTASTHDPITVSATPAPFGLADAEAFFSNADGTTDTQAGSHPYEATFAFDMNNLVVFHGAFTEHAAGGEPRNLAFSLPPGLIGNPNAVPKCTHLEFNANNCPATSQVGVIAAEAPAEVFLDEGKEGESTKYNIRAVYNLAPPAGEPAQFGFQVAEINNELDTSVRDGSDYGLVSHSNNITQRQVIGAVLTLWGEPGNETHSRFHVGGPVGIGETPFLTLPTSCGGPQEFAVRVNQWEHPAVEAHTSFVTHDENDEPVGFTGCESLGFATALATEPDTSNADTPAGLTVEVKPQSGGLLAPEGESTSDLENTTVTLPQGFVINPGQAAGLQSCPAGRPSFEPGSERYGDALTTPEEKEHGQEDTEAASCPGTSKVGIDEIETPLLAHSLKGNVYILQSNPPELKLLVTASGEGVNLKLVGVVHLDEQTGQLTTKFEGTPELPFSDFKLSFSGGAQAALDTPTQCGVYTTNADFDPWSSPFTADFLTNASFTIKAGPDSGACPSDPLPFTPSLTAGSTTDQAGGFTDFSLLLQRGDGQQRIDGLQFKAPAGLTGELSKVPLCTNAQAESNSCPEASKIGHTIVESGPGPYPLVVPEPGQEPAPIYLTESYDGAPFGLSIVVPLHVGPFVLPTQRVRAKIEIDPTTSQLTITTNELPQVVAGVPTDLREVDAVIERPEFMINPTNCDAQEFTGTATGTPPPGVGGPGASAPISSHFGVGSCQSLKFEPKVTATSNGQTSKKDGASLTYKVAYPNVAQGTDADIRYVKVELPRELPSRLTTLQKACTAKVFQASPTGCPKEAVIGHAVVHTQLLPVPLEGPVYFVSNGGEAFPNLVMVLQGDNVTVELVGDTLIKNGVTSTTFKAVPDDPFSSFEITLGQGPYSALAANGNLCKPTVTKTVRKKVKVQVKGRMRTVTRKVKEQVATTLTIPSQYIGQNGATLNANVPIAVTGCPKAHVTKKGKTKTKAKGKKK
jgi:hypothetical protein